MVPFSSTFSQTFILNWRNPLLVEYGFCREKFESDVVLRDNVGECRACDTGGSMESGDEILFIGEYEYSVEIEY